MTTSDGFGQAVERVAAIAAVPFDGEPARVHKALDAAIGEALLQGITITPGRWGVSTLDVGTAPIPLTFENDPRCCAVGTYLLGKPGIDRGTITTAMYYLGVDRKAIEAITSGFDGYTDSRWLEYNALSELPFVHVGRALRARYVLDQPVTVEEP